MKKDYIFFGEKGLTATQANRDADFAKLAYTNEESYLASISFINQNVETIDGTNTKNLEFGLTDTSLIEDTVERIGNLKSLCAWLREAVAAHQRLLNEVTSYSFADYLADNQITLPAAPVCEKVITEDDVIAEFDVKKRNRYYYLEAMAATIGQFVHKNGSIDLARKNYYEKLRKPRSTSGEGLNTLIYTYTPSIDKEEIEKMFYSLQQKHTKFQSELNSIKSEIQSRITNDCIDKNSKYESEMKEYKAKEMVYFSEYNTWKVKEQKRIASLRIIIPNALQEIYNEVHNK